MVRDTALSLRGKNSWEPRTWRKTNATSRGLLLTFVMGSPSLRIPLHEHLPQSYLDLVITRVWLDIDPPALGVQTIDLQRALLTEDLQLIDKLCTAVIPV